MHQDEWVRDSVQMRYSFHRIVFSDESGHFQDQFHE
jgi:hypothetical protein